MSKRRHTLPAYQKRDPCGCARVVVVGGERPDGSFETLPEDEAGFGKCEAHREKAEREGAA